MKKIFLIIFLIITSASCQWIKDSGTPFFSMMNIKIPPGTPTFQKGFRDGCENIVYARGNPLYRAKYKGFRFDPKMIGNSEYRFGHSRGQSFCFMHVISNVHNSADNYLNYYDPTMMAQNYNTVGDGLFDGGVFSQSLTTPGNGIDGIFDVLQKGGGGTTGSAFSSNPFWAGGSVGQFFGQGYSGSYYGQ
ncbi:MAG: hypothetical protein FJX30_00175 [Alphaproteobacteria bacterium]|nr:hypothetical protein [Alphaproteobacteria bacterium]